VSVLDVLLQKQLAGASLSETVAGLAGQDPRMAAVAQALALREEQLEAEARQQEHDEADEELRLDTGLQKSDQVALLQSQLDLIAADVARLQSTVDMVASALGACPTCLGTDPGCLLCRGRGVPGALPPDPEAFEQVTLPAVRARAYARSRSLAREPGTPDPHFMAAPAVAESTERSAE